MCQVDIINMMIKKRLVLTLLLLLSNFFFINIVYADHEDIFDVKELKEAGDIASLTNILAGLSTQGVSRILEVKLKRGAVQEASTQPEHQYIYEIEYIDAKGMVLEIEVDARTAQVLPKEHEH